MAGRPVRVRVWDENPDHAIRHAADSNAAVPSRVVAVLSRGCSRFGVDDVQDVVEDPNSARSTKLFPFVDLTLIINIIKLSNDYVLNEFNKYCNNI